MATHYNEPVDIASSSLTEEGTVYGGEKNLIQGLVNLIKVYEPEVIGVTTTCLAETIGEDIHRIISKFYEEYPQFQHIPVIPVHSAGYSGSQYEGYMKALHQIVKAVPMDPVENGKVNVITSPISPADTRYIKWLLDSFCIDYILLPDLSENLDCGYQPEYNKLPQSGTDIKDIGRMAGAKYTIELSAFTEEVGSIGQYLYDKYQIPYRKCNLPVSLRDNDELIKLLSSISGNPVPEVLKKQRSRFLDAMIDSHKYNAEARAAVFGEPDYVYSTVRLCVENGIVPVIAAIGTKCAGFKELIYTEIWEIAEHFLINRIEILDDVDFQTIEELAGELDVNILIGNSDGRRMAERLGIDLVRRSFPIHDRVGGQRLRTLGYEGALTYLDDISNVIINRKETGFREELFHRYYKGPDKAAKAVELRCAEDYLDPDKDKVISVYELKSGAQNERKTPEERTATHPCFNCGAHQYARIHLPVAPKCNISCNYCLRKYDCPNESRPGVTTEILKPEEALKRYLEAKEKLPNLSVVGIAGPGDALANFPETMKTLELIREQDPKVTFCLSTNGLMLPQYAGKLIDIGVSHVTITMNTIDPAIGAKIYKYVEYMGVKYTGEAAAAILLANQMAGIKLLAEKGIICKVNIVMLKGINDMHIPEVVKKVKELGAVITNIMQMIPVEGSVFEALPRVSLREVTEMRDKCGETMKQMYHCRQCRADAVGTLGNDISSKFNTCLHNIESKQEDVKARKNTKGIQVAVASKSGRLVDQHFGQVTEFYVYEYRDGIASFLEKRSIPKYCNGSEDCDSGEDRISSIIQTISDCKAVIALRIGEAPKEKLRQKGIRVYTAFDRIEASVEMAAAEIVAS
jgi:nitrogenase molybdenum-iron protein alpha/beta subunit/MoaA/NifB/PqqE/SkfB family radical SAM enzyme